MNPGELRHKVQLYALESVQNEFGGYSATETLLIETWAKKEVVRSGNQWAVEAGASVFNEDQIFTVRYRESFTFSKDLIIKNDGFSYRVIAAVTDEKKQYVRIVASRSK